MASSTQEEPYCSVIVPTHRRPVELAECLQALAALEYPRDRFEVIVVDDGGRLPLEPVIEPFRGRLELTLLVIAHSGPAAARNSAAARARGELLVFTDDDCRPAPNWLHLLATGYRSEPRSALGGHTVNALVGNPYASTSQLVIDVGYAHLNLDGETAQFFTTNNLAVPASGFRAVGGLNRSYTTAEDRDFCARWLARGWKLTYLPDAVVYHAHDLTFSRFCRQHFAYGRGALRYHREQARRWNRRIRIDGAYYRELARAPFRRERPGRALVITALLGVWHVTNTAGFVFEWLRWRDRGAGVSSPGCGVLHLSWSGRIGGIERQLAAVVRAASEQDRSAAHVCLLDGRGVVGDDLAAAGLATQLRLGRGGNPVGLWRLAWLLRKLRPRIVHLHTHSLCAFVLSAIALPGAPRVYTEHSPRALQPESRKFRVLYWLVRKTCARVVALAPSMARAIEGRGVDPRRIAVIPNPVAVSFGGTADRGRADTIGVVARLTPSKRVDLLVDAVAELRHRGIDCSAIVVGDGPARSALEAHAVASGADGCVRFVGEQQDVGPWLDQLDVFLMTSPVEIYPVAALEAMARGVPVVAMACAGGLADLATRGGLLLPDRETTTVVEALARLLASREERDELRARGHEVALTHAPETVLAMLNELYRSAEAEGGRAWTRGSARAPEPVK